MVTVTVYKYSKSGMHMKLTTVQVPFREFESASTVSKSSKLGKFDFNKISIKKKESFLDYIFGGCEVSLHVNIDFTLSNGPPQSPNSLHFWGQGNRYERSMRAVGDILVHYDHDQKFPVYGYGGRMQPGNVTSHCFALNGNILNPEVVGVDGMINVYKNAISKVPLHGPTFFAPCLQQLHDYMRNHQIEEG